MAELVELVKKTNGEKEQLKGGLRKARDQLVALQGKQDAHLKVN